MTRRLLTVVLLAGGVPLGAADSLAVHLDGDYLRVSLPHVDFLKGKPLDRLKDGASVAFIGKISITLSPNSLNSVTQAVARFAMSYDIWEERFSVTKFQSPENKRPIAHLTEQAAENWCLDNLVIDRGLLPPDKPFYVQLEWRAEDPKDQLGVIGDPGINLTRLVEYLGRPPRSPEERRLYNAGPFRLADLKKSEVRAVRG
ncbi:MAG TPA: hypothetical protein VG297_17150 [Bryobacteraceae bacterium]|nr:hypothetical protein [Bryobacteraceae bacterium]